MHSLYHNKYGPQWIIDGKYSGAQFIGSLSFSLGRDGCPSLPGGVYGGEAEGEEGGPEEEAQGAADLAQEPERPLQSVLGPGLHGGGGKVEVQVHLLRFGTKWQ